MHTFHHTQPWLPLAPLEPHTTAFSFTVLCGGYVRMDDTAPSRKSSARALQSLACVLPARLAYATAHATLSSTLLPSVAPARSLLRLTSAFLRGSFRVLRSLV